MSFGVTGPPAELTLEQRIKVLEYKVSCLVDIQSGIQLPLADQLMMREAIRPRVHTTQCKAEPSRLYTAEELKRVQMIHTHEKK